MVRPRRHLPSSAVPASALDDDDILSEILRRLPPLPSSLPRASLVCKQWRRLVYDAHFLRRSREHHRKPPLLGFFSQCVEVEFISALDSPDRIPGSRFSPRLDNDIGCQIVDCRHGRVLFVNREALSFLVWAPVTGERRRVGFPPSFRDMDEKWVANGAVICAASEQGHVHGGCHSNPFQVVLLGTGCWDGVFACVYSSETCAWGSVVSVLWPQNIIAVASDCASTLVGNSVFWFLLGRSFGILKFDLGGQNLAAIELPSNAVNFSVWCRDECRFLITPADGGGLSFLYLSGFIAQIWKRKANCDSGGGWMLGSNFDLNNLLSLKAGVDTRAPEILGMDEDDNTMFLSTNAGDFMLHLESMQFKKLSIIMGDSSRIHYPFRSFYSADECENLIPLMFETEVPIIIEGVQGAHSGRSRSKRPAENGHASPSTLPPTQGCDNIVRKKQHEPGQGFSIANCINTMREMVDLSDEEKVASCDLFRDAVNREIFLSLNGTLRTMWLKKQLTEIH